MPASIAQLSGAVQPPALEPPGEVVYPRRLPRQTELAMTDSTFPLPAGGRSGRRLVVLMCLAEALSMTGFAAYPAFLALLRDGWGLTGSAAGFIGGAYFAGYMTAVPILSGLTDRFDARRIHIAACLLAAAGNLGFALGAQGVASAAFFQALAGAGLGGTYMPGLKALTDRVGGPRQSRYVSFYTATFGVGTSLSLFLAGFLGRLVAWPTAFGLLAAGPALAAALVAAGLPARPPAAPAAGAAPGLFRSFAVLGDRRVRGYILRYAVHCFELFGLRSWMVAFILFAYGLAPDSRPPVGATEAAALINFLGIPVSILGNEAAMRLGRGRFIPAAMLASGTLAWAAGFAAAAPWWVLLPVLGLYFVAVMSDSAALTAGLVEATRPHGRGAAMAVYSFAGFGAGFLAPLVFGAVLDAAGGKGAPAAWGLACGSLGAGCLAAALCSRRRSSRSGGRAAPPRHRG
jgi:MFS family permease